MVQRICITIWVTYDTLRNFSIFKEEASKYFILLKFLAKSQSINIQQECRRSANILINIYHLKVCLTMYIIKYNVFKLSHYYYRMNLMLNVLYPSTVLKKPF